MEISKQTRAGGQGLWGGEAVRKPPKGREKSREKRRKADGGCGACSKGEDGAGSGPLAFHSRRPNGLAGSSWNPGV